MTYAPERIWTCTHVGEYGYYFPEAVEAEGEYGGMAVEYVRADLATSPDDPRVKALVEGALNEAERMLKHYGSRDAGGMAQIRAAIEALEKNK